MLTRQQFAILFVLTLLPFLIYTARPDVMGYDSYHFLSISAGKQTIEEVVIPLNILLPLLDGNIIAVKVVLFMLCFSSVLILAHIGKLYNEETGWRAGILIWLAAVFIFEFGKFENDQFAYPLVFAAIYFFLRSYRDSRKCLQLPALILLAAAGWIWGGASYLLVLLAITPGALLFHAVAIPFIMIFWQELVIHAFGWGVLENEPFLGIPFIGLALLGVLNWRTKELLVPGAALLVFGILNPKFVMLAIPFLVVGLAGFYKTNPLFAKGLQNIAIICVVLAGFGLLMQPPFEYEHQAVGYVVQEGPDNITNEWHLGHMVVWYGGVPSHQSFRTNASYENLCRFGLHGNLCVLYTDAEYCEEVKQFGEITVYKC